MGPWIAGHVLLTYSVDVDLYATGRAPRHFVCAIPGSLGSGGRYLPISVYLFAVGCLSLWVIQVLNRRWHGPEIPQTHHPKFGTLLSVVNKCMTGSVVAPAKGRSC